MKPFLPAATSPQASAAAVADFQKMAASAQAGPAEAEEPATPDVPAPQLQEDVLQAVTEFQLMQARNQLQAALIRASVEDAQRNLDRNRDLEKRLTPLRLDVLLLQDYLEQDVPVSEDMIFRFRTPAAAAELHALAAVTKLKDAFPVTAGQSSEQHEIFLLRVAYLVLGLVSLNGVKGPAEEAQRRLALGETEFVTFIVKEASKWLLKPRVLLEEICDQQNLFTIRTRNLLQHAGFLQSQLGKS